MRKILTSYCCKPIPNRNWDWTACYDGYDGSEESKDKVGFGSTEQEAIDNLKEQDED